MNNYMRPEEEEQLLMGGLIPGASQPMQAAPPMPKIINQGNKQFEFMPGDNGSLMTKREPPPNAGLINPPPVTPAKSILPGMPAGVTPDDLPTYLNKQRVSMNKYGPEEQMALQKSLTDRRNGLGYKVTSGAKGFADALMMGVARAGNPGFQQQFENQENLEGQQRMNTLQKANEGNLQRTQANMSLDTMDPSSALSKEAQNTYAPLFQKLGYPESALTNMSASKIENALSLMTQLGGAEIQAQIKEYELEIERARLQGTLGKQESDERLAKEKQRSDSAQTILKGSSIPFIGPSHSEKEEARKVLMDQVSGNEFSKTATNPETGEKVGWNGEKWIPIK